MSVGFELATAKHQLAQLTIYRRVPVVHDGVEAFSRSLRDLEALLPSEDEFWEVVDRRLRRLRFDVFSAPVAFNEPSLGVASRLASIEADLASVSETYPAIAPAAHAVLFRLSVLAGADDNPLGDQIISLAEHIEPRTLTVLTRCVRTVKAAHDYLAAALPSVTSLVVAHGPEATPGIRDAVVCVGALRWFPPSLVESPNALTVVSICHAQVREIDIPDRRLPGSRRDALSLEAWDRAEGTVIDTLAPDEALPMISWNWIEREAGTGGGPRDDEERLASAVALAGGLAVLLDASPDATVLTLDLEATRVSERMRRLVTDQLEAGMFLVLRTEGGGDYVAEIANRLLGSKAAELRQMQRHWKERLAVILRRDGAAAVANELSRRGAVRASEGNLRRWVDADLIRTESRRDFEALMSLAGLEASIDEYWTAMGVLHSAHQRAGFQIRRMLLRAMQSAEGEAGLAKGRLDLSLQEGVGGTLSAIRIDAIADGTVLVPRSRIGRLDVGDD